MPRVHYRKAAKDYPAAGIVKGDMYYYTKLKLQRGGIVKRSKTPFKASQLTTSPFKQAWYEAQESWEGSDRGPDAAREAAEAIREAGNECQSAFDNMPEGLQQGDTGQILENRANECESRADDIEQAADGMEQLDRDDFEDKDDFESELENFAAEVDAALEDMPE